jgi:AP-3 complex subunit delta
LPVRIFDAICFQAANALGFFAFIRADLSAYRPRPQESYAFAEATTSSFDPIGSSEPQFPKCLCLIQPLFTSYTLNPVAPIAQSNIPVPEDLDLDTWIVPPPKTVVNGPKAHDDRGNELVKTRRGKKGKEKESNGTKSKSTKKKHHEANGNVGVLIPSVQEETAEDRAERERVSFIFYCQTIFLTAMNVLHRSAKNG